MLEDNVSLPSNGKLYTKVINWVQRSIWENGDCLEDLMEEVSFKNMRLDHLYLLHFSEIKDDSFFFFCVF